MTNFIFKSPSDLQKISQSLLHKLELIQTELRHQRSDLVVVLALLNKLDSNNKLQKQVDDYYGSAPDFDDK